MDAKELAKGKCEPCRGGMPRIPPDIARDFAKALPSWSLSEDATRIARKFRFEDFAGAMAFVNRVAELAESEGHHPDIAIHWNEVELTLYTHKIGGLHANDFYMAAKVDQLGAP